MDLHTVRSQQLADLGQVNMADANTLVDFVTWAVKTYPADKYVLIMSDHGMGWPGGWSDPAVSTGASTNRQVPLASSIGNLMYLNDIDNALTAIRFQWDPIVFAINDGQKSVPALFTPETYGASPTQAVYTVDGIYTPADGSGARGARLYFRDKILRQVFAFTGNDPSGAPREVITKPGDKFTVLEKWIDLDSRGNPTGSATQDGGTLTFGDQPFRWKDLDAAAGDYVVGFTVEDLDGNPTQSFGRLTVQ